MTGDGRLGLRRNFPKENMQDSAMASSPILPDAPAEGWMERWLHP